jgi:formyl-CoA transferase
MFAPYQAIRCADGYITLGTANDRLFRRFCDLLEHPEWTTEPEFADNERRLKNHLALAARIEAVTSQQPRAHWIALFDANEIPCGPINNYEQVFADPQIVARDMAVEIEHPTLGRMKSLGSPLKMSATPTNPRRRAPMLGEHTDEVLRDGGFSPDEISALRAAGAIR